MDYEKPKPRKGFTVTSVAWAKDGRIRAATYTPNRALAAAQAEASPEVSSPPARSLIVPTRPAAPPPPTADLFS